MYVLIFLLGVVVVVGLLAYDSRAVYHDALTYWESNLSNSADEQANVETLWIIERRTDTEAVARDASTIRLLSAEAGGISLAEAREVVDHDVKAVARINGFMGGAVVDAACGIVAQAGVPAEATDGIRRACLEVQATGQFSITASYPGPANVLFNLAAPVYATEPASPHGQPPGHLLGVVVMLAEPRKTIFRFFAEKSRPDRFAQTEIIWQEPPEAVSFSPRLNALGMKSTIRTRLVGNAFESRAAREGRVEFGEFTDSRGVRVFGVAQSIAPAGASLARKVDRDQALSGFHQRILLEWLAGALSLLLFGTVLAAQHRHLVVRDLQGKLRQQQTLLDLKRHVEASERRYRALFDTAGDAIFLLRGDAFIDCNQRALEMYSCTREDIIGQPITARYPLSRSDGLVLREAALEKLRQAREGQTLHFEWQASRPDGSIFDAEVCLSRVGIAEDVLLLALVRDVSDRKRAEKSLRESEELFRTTFETAGIGMALVDLRGRLANANPALQRMLGYTEEELRGMLFTQFTHPDDRELDWGLYQELVSGKRDRYEIEKRYIRKDGQVVWGNLTGSLVRGAAGRPRYGVGMVEDITERKRAAEELQASEMRFRTLIQRAPVAISISRTGRTLYVNQQYLDMYGFQGIDEVVGHSIGEQWSPECRAMVEERARQRALGMPVPARYEALGQRQDGSVFPVEVAVAKVDLSDGEASVGFLTDITERKRADRELVDRLRFETLLADLSARFADVVAERLDGEIEGALRRVCECLALDGCTLWQASEEAPRQLRLTYTYRSSEEPATPGVYQMDAGEYFPWSHQQIMSGKRNVVAVSCLAELPEEAARDRDTYRKYGVKSVLTIALATGGRPPVGALAFSSTHVERPWPEGIVNRLQLVAQMFADALARQRLQKERQRSFHQLRALAAHLQSVREEERKSVAREIHDQLGQALTAIKLDLSSLLRALPAERDSLSRKGSPLLQLVDETIDTVRRISAELRPGMLDDLGLAATVEWAAEEFASRSGVKCLLDLPSDQLAIDSETATAVFRIFQETLTNVARHAKAGEVQVRLAEEDGALTLEVHDNGRGIGEDELASAESLGILGMRERALLLGGTLTISGVPGKGTTVMLRIPQVQRAH